MFGILCSIVAGALMSVQGVFNTRLTEKIGISEANVIVQGSGFVLSLAVLLFFKTGDFRKLSEAGKLYLTGGMIGVAIIYTVVQGMKALGATLAVGVILISQLLAAATIDTFGIFDTQPVGFHFSKLVGAALMIAGIIVFKLKG